MPPDPREAPPTLDRLPYFLAGTFLFGLKHNLDRFVASALFGKSWSLFNYLIPPEHGASLLRLGREEMRFYGALLLVATPFIFGGVILTLRRLRSAGLPPALVVLFFVPVVNLVFFLMLCVVPARSSADPRTGQARRAGWLTRVLPETILGSAAAAVGVTLLLGLLVTFFGVRMLEHYGWGLFVGLPFAMGLFAALLHGYRTPRRLYECMAVSLLAPILLGALLLAFAVEGVLCLAMAGPIVSVLSAFGGALGYLLQRRPSPGVSPAALLAAALAAPFLMAAERASPPVAPLLEVTTAVEVDASPEVVWRHVVAFSEIAPPEEWLFRVGIAYPLRATIEGRGPGAVRRCVFSTGAFVEPITEWDAPHRLAFEVEAQPPPLQEWTPWRHLQPAHLHDYLRSEKGEFRLVLLRGGRTRLEGTTWYRHDLWPAAYWRVWSDGIIHSIHLRVLRHIRGRAEEETTGARP